MKYEAIMLSIALTLVLSSATLAYASHEGSTWTWNEGYGPEQTKECEFTAYIEKSWVFFTERPWVTGFVSDCDSNEYHEKDRVFVRVLDINGDLVEDNWLPKNPTNKVEIVSQYVFTEHVYRAGSFTGNANVEKVEVVHIKPNQYFFYMPQINSVDFEHRGVYQIELTYGDHVRTIWFASLSPDIPWYLDQVYSDPCIDFENKLKRLQNTVVSLEKQIERYELLDQQEKVSATVKSLDGVEKQIESLKECQA
ncbi:MAG: hypothetical protein O6761_07830 [Thaumarchaeota archaeon]|nr:hypothetical protein [Nitrososphaerota archaeon]